LLPVSGADVALAKSVTDTQAASAAIYYAVWWSLISFVSVQDVIENDRSMQELSIFLIPGFLMLCACIGSCFVVTKYLNRIYKAG
jgi:hypothetical protein